MNDQFETWHSSEIRDGQLTRYNWIVQHADCLPFGFRTAIGAFCYINAKCRVEIQDFVHMDSHCPICAISTIDDKMGKTAPKENCRIGSHSKIMPCVTVGMNSVVGAQSFINRDIPDNAVARGVPVPIKKIR